MKMEPCAWHKGEELQNEQEEKEALGSGPYSGKDLRSGILPTSPNPYTPISFHPFRVP